MLYKYTKLLHLNSILKERFLWFSQIDQLNDPFECNISSFYYSYGTYREEKAEYEKWRSLQKGIFRGNVGPANHYYDHPFHGDFGEPEWVSDKISELEQRYQAYKQKREHLYTLSLSETKESPVLWGNYADNFNGVCICVDEAEMDKAMEKTRYQWRKVKVNYSTERPASLNAITDDIELFMQWKHADWSYEKEIRYVISDDSIKARGVKIFVENAIKGIIVFEKNHQHVNKIIEDFSPQTNIELLRISRTGWFEVNKKS